MSLGRSRNGVILKSPQEIEEMAEAGRLSAKVLREVGARVQPGVSTEELRSSGGNAYSYGGRHPCV